MPNTTPLDKLSRREREAIHIIYQLGEASAIDIQDKLRPPAKNAATRKILNSLLNKGAIARRKVSRQYIYTPATPAWSAGPAMLEQVTDTFFGGSVAKALLCLLDLGKEQFPEQEIAQIRSTVQDKA